MQAVRANGVRNFSYNDQTHIQDPRNIIAMDMVRCMNCNKYYKLDEIHLHLRMHERQQGYTQQYAGEFDANGQPVQHKVKPVYEPGLLDDSETASTVTHRKFTPLDIQTMAPSELPEPDLLRPPVLKPQPASVIGQDRSRIIREPGVFPDSELVGQPPQVGNFVRTQPETRPSSSQIIEGGPNMNNLIEHHEKEDYFEKIAISRTRVEINSKSINIYNNHSHGQVDQHVVGPRIKNTLPSPGQKQWTAELIRKDSFSSTDSRVKPVDPSASRKIAVGEDGNKLQVDKDTTRINTRGKGKPVSTRMSDSIYVPAPSGLCGPSSSTWIRCGPSNESQPDTSIEMDGRYNYTCSGCGGFYCPVCKSTIPPQFRPPPGIKEYLQHSRATHIAHGGTPARQ